MVKWYALAKLNFYLGKFKSNRNIVYLYVVNWDRDFVYRIYIYI
jgi:hypothetical protein